MIRPNQSSLLVTALLACSIPCAASAQVTSNLDNLPGSVAAPSAHHADHTSTTHKHAASHSLQAAPHTQPTASVHHAATTAIPPVPAAPPPPVILPPPFVPVALHPPTPPDPIKADPDAKSGTVALPDGNLRVIFGSGSAALDAATLKTVQDYGNALQTHPEQRAVLLAYAAVPGDDISMPRRIALARALAIRSILINAGVATTRIYPRAIGRAAQNDTAPPDRLDILLQTNPTPVAAPPTNGTPASSKP